MKTLKLSKTLKFDLGSEHEVYLEIKISSTGNWGTDVTVQGRETFRYNERTLLGSFQELKNKIIIIDHIFSFAGIPIENLDSAMKQTQITYNVISVLGPLRPFRNKTSSDLIENLIGTNKLIQIQ
jgi:hypothetical protein